MTWIYRAVTQASPELVVFEVGYVQAQEAVRGLGPAGLVTASIPVVDVFRTVETYSTQAEARAAVHYLNGGSLE